MTKENLENNQTQNVENSKTLEARTNNHEERRPRPTRRPYRKQENIKQTKENTGVKKEANGIKEQIQRKPRKTNANSNKQKTQKENRIFKASKLKIIPLGGLHEVGKNITVFEYENEIVVVDCGLSFPEDDMLGIDIVIPDITYLERNVDKIKGLVITHGHEDHIGSIPYLLKKINIPIYAPKLAVGLIKNKLEEHKLLRSTELKEINAGQTLTFGKNFKVEFIQGSHSIPDSMMLAITTPAGTLLHTGDFKIDFTPIDGKIMNFGRIAELGNQGILALLSDSTNAERKGSTMSESSVGEVFDKLFLHCTKRIVVATFASNVHRVQQIVNSAVKYNRKIAVCGRSMINMITTAKELGYIKGPDNIFIDIDMMKNYTDEQLVLITTGSQGEPMSALTRMAAGEHRKLKITPNDLVIISATPIPGNEKGVSKVIDDLMQLGSEVVYSSLEAIHVSGHACQEEQKLMIALTKPKYFIPVHGEYRQLRAHAETAKSMGIEKENIVMLQNGRVLEMNEQSVQFTTAVPSGRILVDGLGVGDMGGLEFTQKQKGLIMGVGTGILYFLPVLTGAIADRFGYKKVLALAFVVYSSAFALFPQVSSFNAVFGMYIYLALGAALFKPVISATIAKTTTNETSSIGFGIFYMMVNIGAFIGPMVTLLFKSQSQMIFYISAGIILLNFILLFFYKEPGQSGETESMVDTEPTAKKRSLLQTLGEVFLNMGSIFKDLKFLVFLLIVAGFWTMYNQLFFTLPVFISQWVDTSALYNFFDANIPFISATYSTEPGVIDAEFITTMDALYIILLQIAVSALVMRLKPLHSMMSGFLVCSIGMALTLFSQNVLFTLVAILVFALGEMAGSPKVTEYIGRIAPKDKKALYMGYSFIPVFLGNIFAGIISGNVYQAMSDKVTITKQFAAEKGLTVADGLSTNEYFNEVARQVSMSPNDLTNHLWETYNPSGMWVVLLSIGVGATICLFIYDKITSKKANY